MEKQLGNSYINEIGNIQFVKTRKRKRTSDNSPSKSKKN